IPLADGTVPSWRAGVRCHRCRAGRRAGSRSVARLPGTEHDVATGHLAADRAGLPLPGPSPTWLFRWRSAEAPPRLPHFGARRGYSSAYRCQWCAAGAPSWSRLGRDRRVARRSTVSRPPAHRDVDVGAAPRRVSQGPGDEPTRARFLVYLLFPAAPSTGVVPDEGAWDRHVVRSRGVES